jgi:hypothetical protein
MKWEEMTLEQRHIVHGPITVSGAASSEPVTSRVRCRCGDGFTGSADTIIDANEAALAAHKQHQREVVDGHAATVSKD